MTARCKYLKKAASFVVAVQLNLETDGFTYQKWGGSQACKAGDWLVNNDGDTYTVDGDTFERTYRCVNPGVYVKITPVWAEVAEQAGHIRTKEGVTRYDAGAYLVYNDPQGEDGYAVEAAAFERVGQSSCVFAKADNMNYVKWGETGAECPRSGERCAAELVDGYRGGRGKNALVRLAYST